MSPPKIKVLIVEDSGVVRELLSHIISQDPRLELLAAAGSGETALKLLERVSPDVITMDIRLPGMDGFETTRQIMARHPTPIVVVSQSVEAEDLQISLNALRAGALAVLEKPAGLTHPEYQSLAERLCTQLVIMSQVKVIRQRPILYTPRLPSPRGWPAPESRPPFKILGIVASTGGPNALVSLFQALGSDFPLPILLVQHISPAFTAGFAAWLTSVGPLPVSLAEEGDIPQPGRIYIPPPDRHLLYETGRLKLAQSDPVSHQRPSGTVLFQSLARLGPRGLGVLLTGMGDDGAQGLLEMRQNGGYTLAENESTAQIYGMPAAAAEIGAVCEQLSLDAIAPRILALLTP